MSQLQIDVLAKRPHHYGKGRKVQTSLDVGKVDIKEGFMEVHVYGDNCDHFTCISDDSFRRQITDYSGTISIRASTAIRLAAQVFEELSQSVMRAARETTGRDGIWLNQFIAGAVAEKLAALRTDDLLRERAKRADWRRVQAILDRVGTEPPQPGDEPPE